MLDNVETFVISLKATYIDRLTQYRVIQRCQSIVEFCSLNNVALIILSSDFSIKK
jgi:hypothetical protein